MSESETEELDADADANAGTAEAETEPDADADADEEQIDQAELRSCQRCGREQGLIGKYDIYLCRQCFREIARGMGFKKYS